ncbi:MAG: hypothetical protein PHT15_08425, partial [Gallionellaceae bacterium]|nr:hypothetical protein [Gallionellaceae bacterium]
YPLLVRAMAKGKDERGASVMMVAKNFQPDKRSAYPPSGDAPYDLEMTLGGAKLEALPKVGNYYWVTAREEQGDKIIVAATSYYFSNPGPAPTQMLLTRKNELELIPQPLPREHNSYRENEDWKFLLRFDGQPLPGQIIKLETQNGGKASFTSDAQGIATVRFPEDFKQAAEKKEGGGGHDHGPRRASFVLETEYAANGKQYVTAFNSTYAPDAYNGRSLALGAGFTLFGMMLASPMLRRKPEAKKTKAAAPDNGQANSDETRQGE